MRTFTMFASLTTSLAVLALAGCDAPPEMTGPSLSSEAGVTGSATGGGQFNVGVDAVFSLGVTQRNGFDAEGEFRFSTLDGATVEFHGRATCLALDPATHRAWVGGVVTQNNSTDPDFTQEIHGVGRDIWFRMVDYGEGDGAPQADRLTFVGFEGSAGIITSVEYCEKRIWPGPPTDPVDARTRPVFEGGIQVRD